MRIAIDCRFVGKSGIGTFIENIANELIYNHQENEYLVISDQVNSLFAKFKHVDCLNTDIKPFSIREMIDFPIDEINKCDIFFSPYINIPGRIKVPIISTIHDVIFWDNDKLVSKIGYIIRTWFINRTVKLSKTILTVSNFSKERILYHFPKAKDVEILNNCISNDIIGFSTSNIQKQDYFIYVGNIKAHKGLSILLRAFAKAQNNGLKSKLVLVGSAEKFRTTDKEFIQLLKKTNNVEFTGWVDNKRLCTLIASAKALILPSTYEGFGIPPMEAMYLGTKAIISDIPVLKEVYEDFPVTYFKVGNSDDLSQKLLMCDGYISVDTVRKQINDKFNCSNEVNKLLQCISRNIQTK